MPVNSFLSLTSFSKTAALTPPGPIPLPKFSPGIYEKPTFKSLKSNLRLSEIAAAACFSSNEPSLEPAAKGGLPQPS